SDSSGSVAEHDGMPIAAASQAVLQHESGDSMGVEPMGVVGPFVLGEASVTPTRADDHGRSGRGAGRWVIWGECRGVFRFGPKSSRGSFFPEWELRLRKFGGVCQADP